MQDSRKTKKQLIEELNVLRGELSKKNMKESRTALQDYREFFFESPVGQFQASSDGSFMQTNKSLAGIFGFDSPEEMIKTLSVLEEDIYVQPEKRTQIIKEVKKSLSYRRFNVIFRRKDNTKFEGELKIRAVRNSDNEVLYFIGTLEDITEKRSAKIKILESEAKYRELIEMLPFTIYETDTKGNLTYVNKYGQDKFGIRDEDLKNRKSAAEYIHPEWRAKAVENITKTLEGSPNYGNDYVMLDKEGRHRNVVIYTTRIIENGRTTGLRGIILDISDYLNADKAIQESHSKLRTILNSIDEMVFLMSPDGCFIDFFQQEDRYQLIMPPKEFLGKHYSEILPREMSDNVEKAFSDILAGEDKKEIIYNYKFDKNIIKWYQARITPLKDEKGSIVYFISVIREITDMKEREHQLKESRERFKSFFEFSMMGMAIFVPKRGIIEANREMSRMTGYSREELLTLDPVDFTHPEEKSTGLDIFYKINSLEIETLSVETRLLRKDNTSVYVELNLSAVGKANEGRYYIIICRDLTETKNNKIILDEWASFVKLNPNPVIKYNQEGIILLTNSAAMNVFAQKNIVGMHINELLPKIDINVLKNAVSSKTITQLEYEYLGSYYSMVIKGVPEKQEGHIYFYDITRRKNMEAYLKENMEKLNVIINNANALIYMLNLDGKIIFVSPNMKDILGYEPYEVLDVHFSELIHAEFYDLVYDHYLNLISTGNPIKELEFRIRHKDGRYRWIFTNASLARDKYDKPRVVIGLADDITERKNVHEEILKAKQVAEETNKLKSIIIENMGHELRTPLNSIFGFIDLLLSYIEDKKMREYILNIKYSGERLYKTLTLMMELSRIEADRMKLNLEMVNISDTVRELLSYYYNSAKEKDLYIRADIKNEKLFSYIDEKLFNEVMRQLLDNAMKFTNEGGITVETDKVETEGKKWVQIRIIDTGIGIEKDQYQQIFEAFRQGSEGLTRSFEGIGLGLTISYKIVKLMEGEIDIKSKAGEGTAFNLRFPLSIVS